MKYYSEMTDKVYETKEECEKAEEAIVAKRKPKKRNSWLLKTNARRGRRLSSTPLKRRERLRPKHNGC